jgi:hypothetical protein
MSHLAGNWHHHLPGERRTDGARPADGGTRVPANNQTLRPNKGRDYTERGRTHPVVKFVSDRHCEAANVRFDAASGDDNQLPSSRPVLERLCARSVQDVSAPSKPGHFDRRV